MWLGCFVRATEWVHHGTTVLCVSVDVYLWTRGSLKGMGWCKGACEGRSHLGEWVCVCAFVGGCLFLCVADNTALAVQILN